MKIRDIADGTSNTIAVSERVKGTSSGGTGENGTWNIASDPIGHGPNQLLAEPIFGVFRDRGLKIVSGRFKFRSG